MSSNQSESFREFSWNFWHTAGLDHLLLVRQHPWDWTKSDLLVLPRFLLSKLYIPSPDHLCSCRGRSHNGEFQGECGREPHRDSQRASSDTLFDYGTRSLREPQYYRWQQPGHVRSVILHQIVSLRWQLFPAKFFIWIFVIFRVSNSLAFSVFLFSRQKIPRLIMWLEISLTSTATPVVSDTSINFLLGQTTPCDYPGSMWTAISPIADTSNSGGCLDQINGVLAYNSLITQWYVIIRLLQRCRTSSDRKNAYENSSKIHWNFAEVSIWLIDGRSGFTKVQPGSAAYVANQYTYQGTMMPKRTYTIPIPGASAQTRTEISSIKMFIS